MLYEGQSFISSPQYYVHEYLAGSMEKWPKCTYILLEHTEDTVRVSLTWFGLYGVQRPGFSNVDMFKTHDARTGYTIDLLWTYYNVSYVAVTLYGRLSVGRSNNAATTQRQCYVRGASMIRPW